MLWNEAQLCPHDLMVKDDDNDDDRQVVQNSVTLSEILLMRPKFKLLPLHHKKCPS